MSLRDIVLTQKREKAKIISSLYVKRTYDSSAFSHQIIKVIIGPRRAGKSFFALHELFAISNNSPNNQKPSNSVNVPYAYLNFDDERLIKVENYDDILNQLLIQYPGAKILFLDEIQNLPNWEIWVNRLQRNGYHIVLTGSNSNLLSSELASTLTGRYIPIQIFPFSYSEYLNAITISESNDLTESEQSALFDEYIINGGYPETILIKNLNSKEYLRTLFQAVLFKDIVFRYQIRDAQGLDRLCKYLLSAPAQEISIKKVSNVLKISPHIIQSYLTYLENAFLFFEVHRFSYKAKEIIMNNKKIYCIDNGFITRLGYANSSNLGWLYENLMAVELKKRELAGELEFYTWKNAENYEIDFIIKRGIKITALIQISVDVSNVSTKSREIRALLHAQVALSCSNLYILTGNYEEESQVSWYGKTNTIHFIPMWKFLLKDQLKNI